MIIEQNFSYQDPRLRSVQGRDERNEKSEYDRNWLGQKDVPARSLRYALSQCP